MLQLHRSLHGFDALAPQSDGYMERGLKPLIGFDQVRVLIRRSNRLLGCQLAPLYVTAIAHSPTTLIAGG